ncbi:MAG: sigma-54 dependent transcriptional regulator [Bacteroidales bacterium]|nr:sigma-54 dependent transcriptional regulator [Bacteroidales bacterium]MCF8391509.1 sigma-54 dependent transcriptional regulator [Bacteroidales bacterium]
MKTEKQKINVLVIDDDPVFRNLLRSILKEKVNVFAVEAPSTAFTIIKNEKIDIIICDFKLPEMNGLEVLEIVKKEFPDIEVIMISSAGTMDTVITALRKGAADFIKKPFTAIDIWVAVERIKKFAELSTNLNQYKKKNSLLREAVNSEFGTNIIGKSPELLSIKQQMALVAKTPDTSVLIIGESGTGKELVARGIHNLSKRKDELFSAVNMSAVPESLFESEFFGHKKGSFTGALSDKAGWFETANGGTLFFDEIGEMSMALQVKLLRVLEDRRFTRVGTQGEQKFDVRIVAATNKSNEELSSGKTLRLDLYHRLSTFIIELPPLRKRQSDVTELANYFFNTLSLKLGKQISGIHPEVYQILKNYSFPGNIRELKNIMERAIILCDTDKILPVHFPSLSSLNQRETKINTSVDIFDLQEMEKQTILKALQKVDYNKAEAARLLNIEWNALYRRIQKFNIELP